MRRGSAAQRYAERRAWLEARLELIEGVPTMQEDVTGRAKLALDALELKMVTAKLFGDSTLASTRRQAIRLLVGELRTGVPVTGYF